MLTFNILGLILIFGIQQLNKTYEIVTDITKAKGNTVIVVQNQNCSLPYIPSRYSLRSLISFEHLAVSKEGNNVDHYCTLAFDETDSCLYDDALNFGDGNDFQGGIAKTNADITQSFTHVCGFFSDLHYTINKLILLNSMFLYLS